MARIDSNCLHKHFRVSDDWWNITKDDKGNPPSRSLFIGNIPNGTKGSSIRDIFEAYGKIETSSPAGFGQADRGFALLTYGDIDSAQRAISRCYGHDLFNQGAGCKIRFSKSQQQTKTPVSEIPSSKVGEARSEWFQQSEHSPRALARAQKIEHEDALSRVEPTATQLPPTAPKKMLEFAKKVLTSPSAPRTTRVDISPPPLRRMDTYRPDPATLRGDQRRSSHEQRPKDIDRYVPSYRLRDDAYSSYRDNESHSPPRRGRSPGWSSSYSQAFEARFSGSEDRRSSPIQASTQNKALAVAQACDLLDRPAESFKPGTSQLPTASADTAISSLRNATAAKRDQQEGTTAKLDLAKGVTRPLYESQIAALEILPNPVVVPPATDSRMVNLQSLPSATKAQEDVTASTSTSPTWHRLRPPADDTSSITSSSTKSSQRRRQCNHCKAPDSLLLGVLVKCSACPRRYHGNCGTPRPISTKEHEDFTCGRCARKSKPSTLEQTRAASPELGTPRDDIVTPDASMNEQTKGYQDSEIAVQPSVGERTLLTTREPASWLDESKAAFDTRADDISSLAASSLPDVLDNAHVVNPPTAVTELEEATQIRQEHTKHTLHHPSTQSDSFEAHDSSAAGVQRTKSASAYRKPYVTTEAEEGDGSVVGDFLPASPMTSSQAVETSLTNFDRQEGQHPQQKAIDATTSAERPRQDTVPPPSTKSFLEEYSALSMAPTRIQKQAMEMVQRYKSVTCPDWMSSRCKYTSYACNFAHYDTGIDLPGTARDNPHWTCYRWMHKLPCPHGDCCPYAHKDTGLYVGLNGKYSTKHLTCSFWQNGGCVHSDTRCLFAHRDTGYSASGRVARDVTNRAKMTSQCRGAAEAGNRGSMPSSQANEQPRALPQSPPILRSRPAASMVPAADGRLFALDLGSPESALESNTAKERLSKRPQSPAMKKRTTLPLGSIETTCTAESSPYSPKSMLGDNKGIDGVDTPFSPTSSIARGEQKFLYGVDTPYSPTFTMATTEQSSPNGENNGTKSKANPVSNSHHSEINPRLRSSFSPMSAATARDAGSGLSSFTETTVPPQRTRERNEAFTTVASATTATSESRVDQMDKPSSNEVSNQTFQGTYGNSRSDPQGNDPKPAGKAVSAGAAPSKHYAKRSTVDPRTIRRNMLASAAAKSASPVEGSVSSITSIKKCEKCDKRIFGSASFCTSCSKDSTSAHASRAGSPERSKPGDPRNQSELSTSGERSHSIHSGIAKFMEANAARSVLAVAKEHMFSSASTPTSAKSLKRPHEGDVFIQRKRPKVMVPLRKPSTTKREGQACEASQMQHVSIVDSKLKFSKPLSIDQVELNRHENNASGPSSGAASGPTRDQSQRVEVLDQPDNNKENRRPSYSSMSQTTEETEAKVSQENGCSEVTPTTHPKPDKSPPKQSVSATRTQPEIVAENGNEGDNDNEVLSELSSITDDPLPEQRIMLKLKVSKTTPATRCCTCRKHHKSCLHDEAGHMDPARCADYLERVKHGSRKHDNYWSSRLPEIRAAAKRYTNGEYEEDSEPDDNSDGLEIWQDAAESMVPASPSSSEDPLGHIDSSTTQGLRPRSGKLDGAHSNSSSTEKTKARTLQAHPAIPTPAHTPSPAVGGAEIPITQQTPSKAATQPTSKSPKRDLKKALGWLRKRGVQFDSGDDSDEDMEDTRPSATAQPFSWPPKASSHDLFEVAPALRPPPEPTASIQKAAAPSIPNLRAGLSKKELWKNLSSIQCAERRARYGNPHKVLDRALPSQMVKTTIQEEAPLTEQQRLAFHVPAVETKEVKIPFETFLGMPEEPIVVRENTFRNREGKVVEFDLAFRDGKKSLGVTVGGRMMGDGKMRWPFARG